MREEFLHFVWKNSLYERDRLSVADGTVIQVLDPGTYNRDSGPDFFNARIKIDGTILAGNVEIHLDSSHWYTHNHHMDRAYNNVILHVVAETTTETFNEAGNAVLTVNLRFKPLVYNKYNEFLIAPGAIGCRSDIGRLSPFIIRNWIYRCAIERLELKAEKIRPVLHELNNNWEETLYRFIAAYFGHNVNSGPFYRLASSLPLSIIRKHADNNLQVEALLFGQAGMLEEGFFKEGVADEYFSLLQREYKILGAKYSLQPLHGFIWKFHRMRPSSFPTVRISQMASLFCSNNTFFASVREVGTADELLALFSFEASEYWRDHFTFGKTFPAGAGRSEMPGAHGITGDRKRIGMPAVNLALNAAIPLIWVYGRENSLERYCEKAICLSESLPPEKNRVTREWASAGVIPLSAFDSQGLITIRESYCRKRRCLECPVGTKLIAMGSDSDPRRRMMLEENPW